MINAILIFLLLSTPFTMMGDVEQPQILNLSIEPTCLTNEIINVTFDTSSVEGLEQFLEWSKVDETEYDFDNYNCVNFTVDLIKELEHHGFNSYISILRYGNGDYNHEIVGIYINETLMFIEPQNDKILKFNELKNYYNERDYNDIIIYGFKGEWSSYPLDVIMRN